MGKLIQFPLNRTSQVAEVAPVITESPTPAPECLDRDTTIARIKAALKQRSGRQWSVTGGRGTAYGWIAIKPVNKYLTGDFGYMTDEDCKLLADLLGLDKPIHHQGVSIPAGSAYRREYVDRAEGRTPSTIGTPYWD